MASGGIYDQVGGGFARYSVDARWTVPHFEKMLYDNALLARAYLHGWLASGDALLRRTCEETLDWALREMRAPGRRLLQLARRRQRRRRGQVLRLDGRRARRARSARTPTPRSTGSARATHGNFHEGGPGANVLESRGAEPDAETRERIRARLLEVRARRVRPATDDKRLTSWNALMISALADAGAALGREDYLDAARETADFLLDGDARRRTGGCCAPSTAAAPSSRRSSRTTRSCSRR